ncbi:prostate and testis expressed protein 13-like [Castor canadensis]|uniref:Prostate and testis expressed protein 13-like n=1 Tax=Castor canadensis TaxID=51338 RepID=A0AC58LDQ2_CASCN
MFQLLLLGIFIVLFTDAGFRFCNECKHYNGSKCLGGMKSCKKFSLFSVNRSCSTDNYYFNDRITGIYLFRYTTLSCRPCEAGMFQVFHDLLRETFCCTENDRCNDGNINLDVSPILVENAKK